VIPRPTRPTPATAPICSGSGCAVESEAMIAGNPLAPFATAATSISAAPSRNTTGEYRPRLQRITPMIAAHNNRPPNRMPARMRTMTDRVSDARSCRSHCSGTNT